MDCKGRDGGIGRRAGLRIQCPKGVQVQVLFPAPETKLPTLLGLRSLDSARDFGSGLPFVSDETRSRPLSASSSSPVPGTTPNNHTLTVSGTNENLSSIGLLIFIQILLGNIVLRHFMGVDFLLIRVVGIFHAGHYVRLKRVPFL